MIRLLTGRLGLWLAAAALVVALIGAIYATGRQDQRQADQTRDLRDYADTSRRIDDAINGDPGAAAARQRLRDALDLE